MGVILKFALIAAVILIVWFVFRTRGRINIVDTAVKAARKAAEDHTGQKAAPPAKIQALVKCPKCGNYGPKGRPCACESA